ncbi:MAG: RNA methyltransferase [Bacteroidetes bacterium]|nr:RNA methyltransferase [Bacteroidota bacterium]
MISKSKIKFVRSLHQKKYRDAEGLFIAECPKVVNELLHSNYRAKEIFATNQFKVHPDFYRDKVQEISEKELESISALTTPNQVLAVFEIVTQQFTINSVSDKLVLALDDIRDPGNMGTIIRIADWFGINHILCSETCVDIYNPKTVQASMGSMARVCAHYVNLGNTLKNSKPVYAAVLDGKNIYSEKLSSTGVILIGNESKGISENLIKCVSNKISIPNFSSGADSLNAAVATAVICSEFRRRGEAHPILPEGKVKYL